MTPVIRAGGCVRLYDTGPAWHVNTGHGLVGFTGDPVINADGFLTLTLDEPGLPVLATSAEPDETLTARGVRAGVSGGVGACNVRLADADGPLDLTDPAAYAKVAGPNANLWVYVLSVAAEPEPERSPCEPGLTIGDLDAAWKALSPNALQALVTVGTLLGGSGCGCTCRTA